MRFFIGTSERLFNRPGHINELRSAVLDLAFAGALTPSDGDSTMIVDVRDVARLQNGYAFKSEWFAKDGTRLLRNANVGHGRLKWEDVVHLPNSRVEEFARFSLAAEDVVVSLDRPFIATGTKVAQVTPADLPCLLLQRVGRFVFDPETLEKK